jgi:hypothetical protein
MTASAMALRTRRWRAARWAVLLFAVAAGTAFALSLGRVTRIDARAVGVTVAAVPRTDARDTAPSPLDVVDATLVQRDVRMVLRVTTAGAWKAADLTAMEGRVVCLILARGVPAAATGRVCMTRIDGHPALTYTPLTDGTGVTRKIGATIQRPRSSVLEATFLPAAAGLELGPYAWWLQTEWADADACRRACIDRAPDGGAFPADLALLGVVPCFGAAARDLARPCSNPELRLAVEPPPGRADGTLDPFCDTRSIRPISVCAFGAGPDVATSTFALVGDSHAAAMKTALHVLTLGRRWRGLSILLAACPATQARPILPTPARSLACEAWNRNLIAWLVAHPGVDTVFLSAHTTAEVKPADGLTMAATARAGYRDEIRALLDLVGRVVVIRDTPFDQPGHLRCITRAIQEGRPPGEACARSRRLAFEDPDLLAAAARDLRSDRVQLIDLTPRFCDERRCFPVVGGALVHRDETHVTPAFSATLGPFIMRALP